MGRRSWYISGNPRVHQRGMGNRHAGLRLKGDTMAAPARQSTAKKRRTPPRFDGVRRSLRLVDGCQVNVTYEGQTGRPSTLVSRGILHRLPSVSGCGSKLLTTVPNARYFIIGYGTNDLGTWPDTEQTSKRIIENLDRMVRAVTDRGKGPREPCRPAGDRVLLMERRRAIMATTQTRGEARCPDLPSP